MSKLRDVEADLILKVERICDSLGALEMFCIHYRFLSDIFELSLNGVYK